MALPLNLLDTDIADIQRLIDERTMEGPHLDFKRDLPSAWDQSAKHELLADVTSFANAGGGDLIYGIEENDSAEASELVPQRRQSVDAEIRRLQDFILTLAEPRIPAVQVHAIPVSREDESGHVLVIRIPQSWAAPHRVTINNHIYVREGLRKRTLNVPELKAFILRTESQAQRVRDFRSERLAKILTGETPAPVASGPKLVVHVVPTQAAMGLVQMDPLSYTRGQRALPVIGTSFAGGLGLNFDGAFGSIPTAGPVPIGYTQSFRQGYFEAVWVLQPLGGVKQPVLPDVAYENYINKFVDQVRNHLEGSGFSIEVAVFLALFDADQVYLTGPSTVGFEGQHYRFDRKQLLFPEVVISAESTAGRGMRPIFDLVCQSAGLEGSSNYGRDGEWAARTMR